MYARDHEAKGPIDSPQVFLKSLTQLVFEKARARLARRTAAKTLACGQERLHPS